MEILYQTRKQEQNIATVYVARSSTGRMVEFVESVQPPLSREQKWVLIVSTLFGCPVACRFCDAGGDFRGVLTEEQILFQIDTLVHKYFPSGKIDCAKFKIQFARVGEPAFNDNVLKVLENIQTRYQMSRFIPSVSTVAPSGCEGFFERLLEIRHRLYPQDFQLQFSIHSTEVKYRDYLIPVKKWDFSRISQYGRRFFCREGQKIALNFALSRQGRIDSGVLLRHFDPDIFLIKITPVNPTSQALNNGIDSYLNPDNPGEETAARLRMAGYDVILSIGEWEENRIGSNCGQYIWAVKDKPGRPEGSYTVALDPYRGKSPIRSRQ